MTAAVPDVAALAARLPARPRTRFAPSPTGYLHLGHIVNAIYTWGLARALGGEVLLRIEDHDRERSRPEYVHAILDDLAWLGLEPDAGPVLQSDREPIYERALASLDAQGLGYACACSRRQIEHASGTTEVPRPARTWSQIPHAKTPAKACCSAFSASHSRLVRFTREECDRPIPRFPPSTTISASSLGLGMGRLRSLTAFSRSKIAVFAPMPSAIETMAAAVNPGWKRNVGLAPRIPEAALFLLRCSIRHARAT